MTKKYSFLSIIIRNCIEYFKKAKFWGILEQLVSVCRAVCFMANIWVMEQLFDSVSNLKELHVNSYKIIFNLFFLTILLIFQQLLNGYSQYLMSKNSYSNMGKFMTDFQKKMGRVYPQNFENPKFLDSIERAKDCLEYESLGHFASICLQLITYYLVLLLLVGYYMFNISTYIPLIILISFIPLICGHLFHYRQYEKLEKETSAIRRQTVYYRDAIVSYRYSKETRVLGAFSYFFKLFSKSLELLTNKEFNLGIKVATIQLILNAFTFLGFGYVVFLLALNLSNGIISIGAFSSIFIMLSQFFSLIDEIVNTHISGSSEVLAQVTNYYKLMDIDERTGNIGKVDFSNGINLEDVSFKYKDSDNAVINKVNLQLLNGESVALVGENGSGKTTFIRLLTGLYMPNSGNIKIGGLFSHLNNQDSLFKRTSGVFQNFQRYKLTLLDNVVISDINKSANTSEISELLKKVGLEIDNLQLTTILSPDFGGIDLSGGQWQRLAIARGLYRDHDFIVLDEPTAAIDPIEEATLYKMFENISRNKLSILVSHRLGSVKLADKIIVLDKGNIVEIGTHEELLKNNGKYAELWQAQVKWYEH